MKPTSQFIRTILHYNPDSGIWTWINCGKKRLNGKRADHQRDKKRKYRCVTIDQKHYYAHVLAWVYIKGEWPVSDLDHEDLDKGNNKWTNIRIANDSLNNANKQPKLRRVPKGVDPLKHGRYQARIKVNLKSIHLGTYDTADEAHEAYRQAAVIHFGEFARIK